MRQDEPHHGGAGDGERHQDEKRRVTAEDLTHRQLLPDRVRDAWPEQPEAYVSVIAVTEMILTRGNDRGSGKGVHEMG
ncbi:hypothetical protein GCM10009827_056030 [Dactylosporangium maewongense]|uniref:Uncharacterized protein n=1 Tax=Dactylosporangium maewongense TaxID=634393 RepID=A0ABN2B3B8_9ACTN